MDDNLFADLPFNLAGESQSSELTAEAEARIRALAESEARKAQLTFDQMKRDNKQYLLSKDGKTAYTISL